VAVCSSYIGKFFVLPKLVPIPDFNVGEPFAVVVVQRMKKEVLIMRKIVCPAIVTSVTVTEENELGSVVKRNLSR
jgi:hypothetical protein